MGGEEAFSWAAVTTGDGGDDDVVMIQSEEEDTRCEARVKSRHATRDLFNLWMWAGFQGFVKNQMEG